MKKFLILFGPGLLVAATGVGAGDLATSALAGSVVGMSVVIAVILGGVFKYALNEGLARWQLSTGKTLIEGSLAYYGPVLRIIFLVYLIIWSFTVAAALMSASGIAVYALWPVFEEATTGKIVFGVASSLTGLLLVKMGGFRWFERVMGLAVILMLVTVIISVFQLDFDPIIISEKDVGISNIDWFLAVMGGVGGTVTVLCYGYWIREGDNKEKTMNVIRVDLGLAYFITVILGICMVAIGSKLTLAGGGASLLVDISNQLETQVGPWSGWLFRIGAFAAIFSSLLGVWQSVPYLFSDLLSPDKVRKANIYNVVLYALSIVPIIGLWIGFAKMQKIYAICGALFTPALALTLILLHFHSRTKGHGFHNSLILNIFYGIILVFFALLLVLLFV